MTLSEFAAAKRLSLLAQLQQGRHLNEGEFDERTLKEALALGNPRLGATRFHPDRLILEFIFPNPIGAPIVLAVTVTPPERIVYLPVPKWVVESIWQGEIDGSFHFESEARRLVGELKSLLEPEENAALFGKKQPTHRE